MKAALLQALRTRHLGRECWFFDTLESTQTTAADYATKGAAHGALVWARVQTAGRGRMGRTWLSGDGSLCASVILRDGVDAGSAFQWSFVAGLALHDVITARIGPGAKLKWPNDVLIVEASGGARKVAGILCTLELQPHPAVIVGVGVNLGFDPVAHDPTLAGRAAPLPREDAGAWLAELLLQLERRADEHLRLGALHTLAETRARLAFVGEIASVKTAAGELRGRVLGLNDAFELRVEDEAGRAQTIAAADVWPAAAP
ncbi:MAG: biotin--[acetyl-CoA-carboxylase] ligase [Deltaproteobacteria bacterium]|nr:biotin--[acetyl-CoA-carboxylase] ligase [Deltaproteobacteria bacterium]